MTSKEYFTEQAQCSEELSSALNRFEETLDAAGVGRKERTRLVIQLLAAYLGEAAEFGRRVELLESEFWAAFKAGFQLGNRKVKTPVPADAVDSKPSAHERRRRFKVIMGGGG